MLSDLYLYLARKIEEDRRRVHIAWLSLVTLNMRLCFFPTSFKENKFKNTLCYVYIKTRNEWHKPAHANTAEIFVMSFHTGIN